MAIINRLHRSSIQTHPSLSLPYIFLSLSEKLSSHLCHGDYYISNNTFGDFYFITCKDCIWYNLMLLADPKKNQKEDGKTRCSWPRPSAACRKHPWRSSPFSKIHRQGHELHRSQHRRPPIASLHHLDKAIRYAMHIPSIKKEKKMVKNGERFESVKRTELYW